MWLWSSLLPFFQFYSVFFEMDGPDTEDTGELCIHKVKEILCFVLCPLASSSQLCIWFMDCYWVCTGKASQPVCGSSRHQAVITVIQNKRFPNLWKRDYIWLICVSATIFGLKSNMAEKDVLSFITVGCSSDPLGQQTRGRAVTMGHCELLTATC